MPGIDCDQLYIISTPATLLLHRWTRFGTLRYKLHYKTVETASSQSSARVFFRGHYEHYCSVMKIDDDRL